MFDRFKRDPVKRAKKHIEKALVELEEDYHSYASIEYEKAAQLFLETEETDFAVKYYREAAICALYDDDHLRASEMKVAGSEVLLMDNRFGAASNLYSEASDHLFRIKKLEACGHILGLAVIASLAARSFDTAVNILKKAEKRLEKKYFSKIEMLSFAEFAVDVLFYGRDKTDKEAKKIISKLKPKETEANLVNFVADSVKLGIQTEVVLEWAGKELDSIPAKNPIEFELRYRCPVPVKVVEYRYNMSNGLRLTREPEFSSEVTKSESWLIEVCPDLSGDGVLGPFRLTLEGEEVLVHKPSNTVEFRIARAPSDLKMSVSPKIVTCSLGDEAVFDVNLQNDGDGPADNVRVGVELSEGLEVSLGSSEKVIQFIGSGESMVIQIYVRPVVSLGEESVTVKVIDSRTEVELTETVEVTVN